MKTARSGKSTRPRNHSLQLIFYEYDNCATFTNEFNFLRSKIPTQIKYFLLRLYALNAISTEEDGLIVCANGEDTERNIKILIASLRASFIDSANQVYENMDQKEKTMEEFVAELAELADKLLEMGEDDA